MAYRRPRLSVPARLPGGRSRPRLRSDRAPTLMLASATIASTALGWSLSCSCKSRVRLVRCTQGDRTAAKQREAHRPTWRSMDALPSPLQRASRVLPSRRNHRPLTTRTSALFGCSAMSASIILCATSRFPVSYSMPARRALAAAADSLRLASSSRMASGVGGAAFRNVVVGERQLRFRIGSALDHSFQWRLGLGRAVRQSVQRPANVALCRVLRVERGWPRGVSARPLSPSRHEGRSSRARVAPAPTSDRPRRPA